MPNLIAHSSMVVNTPAAEVWEALTNPALIRQCLFGTKLTVMQDGNATEEAGLHSEQNWNMVLAGIKNF